MALPENRIKKIKLPDNTEYNIVPEMLGKNGFSAELPTLTENSTIALSSDVNTKIINLDLSTGVQESGDETLYIPLTEEQFNLCINKDVEVFVNVISPQQDYLSYTFKRSGIWNTRSADFYTHIAVPGQMSVQLTAEAIQATTVYWFKISALEQPGSGTVTSVIAEGASGSHINVSGSPITTAGTLTFDVESGYSIPSTTQQTTWTNKYSKPSGGIPDSDLASTFVKKVNNSTPDSSGNVNVGTVTSVQVQAGTGLSSSQSTAQTGTLNTTISVASGYKLPTTTEWNKVVLTDTNQDISGQKTFTNPIIANSGIDSTNSKISLSVTDTGDSGNSMEFLSGTAEYDDNDNFIGTSAIAPGHFTVYGDNDNDNQYKPSDETSFQDLDTDYFNTGITLRDGDNDNTYKLSFPAKSGVFATTDDCEIPIDDLTQINS